MRLVKVGSVIGFRNKDVTNSSLALNTYSRVDGAPQESISFGRVVRSDTVRRQWHVQQICERNVIIEQVLVQDTQLAGVENTSKLNPLLLCDCAPDSSATIQALGQKPSIGHLILTLRWSSQFHSEIHRKDNQIHNSDAAQSTTVRLAEMVSAFLCTELSLWNEIQKMHNENDSSVDHGQQDIVVANQIFDLFGEASDIKSSSGQELSCTLSKRFSSGRLHSLLSDSMSWEHSRNQLQEYIQLAVIHFHETIPSPKMNRYFTG